VSEVGTVTLPEPADGPAPDDVRMERSDKQTFDVDVNTSSSVSGTGFIGDVISSSSSVHGKPEVVGRSPRAPHKTASVVDTEGRYEIAMEPRDKHYVNPTISDSNDDFIVPVQAVRTNMHLHMKENKIHPFALLHIFLTCRVLVCMLGNKIPLRAVRICGGGNGAVRVESLFQISATCTKQE
jgi:hypothetical protein